MDTGLAVAARIQARARINFVLVATLAIIAVLAVAAGLLFTRSDRTSLQQQAESARQGPASAITSSPIAASSGVDVVGVGQLLVRAGDAIKQQRYLAPPGNNAFELYLRVLRLQPGNRVATDAMRETFSLAADSAEQTINSARSADAERQIDLLATADPANYIVTILRSKLSAQRKMLDQQQAEVAATQQQESEARASDELANEVAQQRAMQLAAQPKVALASPKVVLHVPEPPTFKPKPNVTLSTEAVLLQAALPTYPASALSEKRSGWVVVSFVIGVDGRTNEVQVVNSKPRRIFDRAATDAVRRYRFKPATRNGTPVPSVRQQRIEFAQ